MRKLFSYKTLLFVLLAFIVSFSLVSVASAQDDDPDVTVIDTAEAVEPGSLEKISWEAIIAGSVLALIIQLTLNLLGISVGMMSIDPVEDEDAVPQGLGMGSAIWVGLSTLISLFVGGWVAGRLANIPDNTDGALHGILTWGVVMLISTFLLATTIGRIISGISTLVGQTLTLAGRTAGAVASGAADVAGAAMSGAATVAASAAPGAMNMARDAASGAARTARNAGDMAMDNLYRMAEESPEVRDALELQDLSFDTIKSELMNLMRRSGVSPEAAQYQAQGAMQDAKAAAQYAMQHPEDADKMATYMLRRVLRRGQSVVEDTDRQDVIRALSQRAGISEQQAYETLDRWEKAYNQAKDQTERARQQAMDKIQQMQYEAQNKIDRMQNQAQRTMRKAEYTAREAADTTVKAIGALAGAAFVALVLGAIAAGLGGLIGAPADADVVEEVSQVISSLAVWLF